LLFNKEKTEPWFLAIRQHFENSFSPRNSLGTRNATHGCCDCRGGAHSLPRDHRGELAEHGRWPWLWSEWRDLGGHWGSGTCAGPLLVFAISGRGLMTHLADCRPLASHSSNAAGC
jgi:hypothetical protein